MIAHGQFIVCNEFGCCIVRVLRDVEWKFERGFAVLDINVEDIIVILTGILCLVAAAGCINNCAHCYPLLCG